MKYDQEILLNGSDDVNDAYNDFYASVSVLFRIASFVFLVAFLAFIVCSAFGSQDAITYDNLEYIVRNFSLTLDEKRNDSVYSIRYNLDSSRSYALLGDKFTICGNSGISIYSSTGRLTCSDSFSFKNPILETSDKYALIYDSGNCDLVIYNSFTKVHSQTLDNPIRGAAMSQNGCYALITSSDEYTSTVEVYNDDFQLIYRFNKTGYVLEVDMYNDLVLITTVDGSDDFSGYNIQVVLYDIKNGETVSDVEMTSSFPLACEISSSGFFLVCKEETIAYNVSSKKAVSYSYNDSIIADFDLTYDVAALLLDNSNYDISYKLVAINNSLDVMYDHTVLSTVYDIELCGTDTCLLVDDRILILNSEKERTISLEKYTVINRILSYDSHSLYLCTDSAAPLIDTQG